MTKIKLSKERYNLLKEIDFEGYEAKIIFYDDSCEFETDIDEFEVYMAAYISICGMDEKQDRCTEYGRQLYDLYDYVMDEVSEE